MDGERLRGKGVFTVVRLSELYQDPVSGPSEPLCKAPKSPLNFQVPRTPETPQRPSRGPKSLARVSLESTYFLVESSPKRQEEIRETTEAPVALDSAMGSAKKAAQMRVDSVSCSLMASKGEHQD